MNKAPEHELQKHCVTWFKYRYPHLKALFFFSAKRWGTQ